MTPHDPLDPEALGLSRCATRTPGLALPEELADRLALQRGSFRPYRAAVPRVEPGPHAHPFDAAERSVRGRVSARLGHTGVNLLVAATAEVHPLKVAKLNPRDFEPIVWDSTSGWLVCHPQGMYERHWNSSIFGRPGDLARLKALVLGGVANAPDRSEIETVPALSERWRSPAATLRFRYSNPSRPPQGSPK